MVDSVGEDSLDRRWGYGTEQRLRDENQDTHGIFAFPGFTLAIVCDGMGGHHGGAHASALAVRTIYDAVRELSGQMSPRDALIEAVRRANQTIYDTSRRSHRLMGMGTTVAAAVITDEDEAHIVHVGDSRVYIVRGGEAAQLTRDHTMVNLFVEAELLSPEDAASHPEAHVLSRSLGVERQVEVEVQEPIPVEYADTFVLCSDGVHGVLTEWEFGRIDWSDPQEGVWESLRLVAAREGDDNASVVAMIVGEFEGPGRPPTNPPVIENLEDPVSGTEEPPEPEQTPDIAPPAMLVNSPTLVDIPATPAPAPQREAARSPQQEQVIGVEGVEPGPEGGAQPDSQPKEPEKKKKKKKKGSGGRVLALVGVLVIGSGLLLGGGAIAYILVNQEPGGVPLGADPLAVNDPTAAAAIVADPVEPVVQEPPVLFAPKIPATPDRPGHRPEKYLRAPPGGSLQLAAVQAARKKECSKSFATIREAMQDSIDYAALYPQAWKCFNVAHQDALASARATTLEELQPLEVHFRGAAPDEAAMKEKERSKLPDWYYPAWDGIEHRLDAFLVSGDRDLLADVMTDKLGELVLTDDLTRDVLIEATAAAGLSRIEEPDEAVEALWARRLFYATRAMNGSIGELIRVRRGDVVPQIEALLAEATKGADAALLADPKAEMPLPDEVREAWAVAMGAKEPPVSKAGPVRDNPNAPTVRPPKKVTEEDLRPKIYRQGN